jgi:hypothetical protein
MAVDIYTLCLMKFPLSSRVIKERRHVYFPKNPRASFTFILQKANHTLLECIMYSNIRLNVLSDFLKIRRLLDTDEVYLIVSDTFQFYNPPAFIYI